MSVIIHPSSVVEKTVQLGADVKVGPFCHLKGDLQVGDNCTFLSHVVADGPTVIGENNKIYPFVMLGCDPQDLTYNGEPTKLVIGNGNTIREGTGIHRGTVKGGGKTVIGNDNLIMGYCHIAHDCIFHNNIVIANGCLFAGHVEVFNNVIIGGMCAVGQFVRIGDYAFMAGQSGLRRDLPPFMSCRGDSSVPGPNLVGLKRNGFSVDDVKVIRDLFRIYFLGKGTSKQSLDLISEKYKDNSYANKFLQFINKSSIGVQR